jgi:hypothetical protein
MQNLSVPSHTKLGGRYDPSSGRCCELMGVTCATLLDGGMRIVGLDLRNYNNLGAVAFPENLVKLTTLTSR